MRSLAARVLGFLLLAVGLLFGVQIVQGIVNDRINNKRYAKQSVVQSFPGGQTLLGPVLVVDYEERYFEEKTEEVDKKIRKYQVPMTKQLRHYVLPENLKISQNTKILPRHRGLFTINTFASDLVIQGNLRLPSQADLLHTENKSTVHFYTTATLQISTSDARGLGNIQAQLNDQTTELLPTVVRVAGLPTAQMRRDFPADQFNKNADIKFTVNMTLSGIDQIGFVPLGKNNDIQMNANWPHPSFEGALLPTSHRKTGDGFSANWQISSISSEARSHWLNLVKGGDASEANATHAMKQARLAANQYHEDSVGGRSLPYQSVGVRFIDPVDQYTLSDRATKYAAMFVFLTLGAFLMFEIFKKMKVHPIQYGLVGLAQVLFFLLLLSLSEHIGFEKSYACAAAACVSLIAFYSASVLKSWKNAMPIGAGLSALYVSLYFILNSEQNALLMGTLLIFSLVAALMIATRRTNWFELISLSGRNQNARKE
jgi:inner membrane protein